MQANEVLQFIEENDVKFIRLAFTDLFGQMKNIAVLPSQLATAFESGVPIDATAVDGCEGAAGGDLLLKPDPDTLCILPWRPQSGRVCRLLCGLYTADGEPYEADSRAILRRAIEKAADVGFDVRIATDCEFYLFNLDENGKLTGEPHDEGGYMDVAPLDKCEDVRRDICLTLEQMNIRPESSHHERGRGQNEVDFHRADPLTAADHYAAFVHAVRAVSSRYGVHATFLPKPLLGEASNGLHVSMSFYRGQQNLFRMENGELGEEAKAAMAGVLRRLPEITLFLNPLPASYDRLASTDAFNRLCWSTARDKSAVRIPLPQERFARMQLSSPDPTMNVYLGFALLMHAALEGIASGAKLADYCHTDAPDVPLLPRRMEDALALAEKSDFVNCVLPPVAVKHYKKRAHELMEAYSRDPAALTHAQMLRF